LSGTRNLKLPAENSEPDCMRRLIDLMNYAGLK
jgi:hypothetical protein